jgi:TonB-linked SusC/RagA family outer membrane protein
MIKKFYRRWSLAVGLLLMLSSGAYAQERTVSGAVKDANGGPLPGVNILSKGTSNGTTTDSDGKYSISVNGGVLVYSFIGFVSQEIEVGSQTTLDVTLAEDATQLSEVVVTALGIERSTKALQYSVTEVKGDNFVQARENNLGAQLSGRVAGVNVTKPSSGPAGSTRIVIRGNKSINGQNQPLVVVDGIPVSNGNFGQAGMWGGRDEGDGLNSINPDDVESITVLKGANASALYGTLGGNGVINIVTKKGTSRKGLGIDVGSNFVAESIMNFSDLQTKYGAGNYVNGVATKPTTFQQAFDWGDDSWGPAMDGSQVMQFDGVNRPYSYVGDNWKRFYQTGTALTNSFALNGGNDKQTFRFSVSDLRSKGVVPNTGFDRTNLSLATNGKFGKLTLNAKVMYSHEFAKNRPVLSDSPANAPQMIWRTPPSVNVLDMKGDPNKIGAIPAGLDPLLYTVFGSGVGQTKIPGQELLPAQNNWGQNPYWSTFQFINNDTRDRFNSSAQLRYDITSFLYVSGRVGMDWFTRLDDSLTPQGTGYDLNGSISKSENRSRQLTVEGMLGFNKGFGKINVNAFVAGNSLRTRSETISANGSGFNVAFFPSINNAVSRNYGYGFGETGINSLFGSAEIDYNGIVYLTATARSDWFSVLNPAHNNLVYPSVGASFVFSDAFSGLPSWLSFGKFRASWAQSGIVTIGAYSTNLTYSLYGFSHVGYSLGSISSAMGQGGGIPNSTLVPPTSTEMETGLDLRLFQNRIGLDFTYYRQLTTDDIVAQNISRASGFGSTSVNIGKVRNRGVEIQLTGTPVKGPVTWDVSLNLARNRNLVVSLLPGLNEIVGEEPRTRNVFVKHIVGQPFGTLTGKIQRTDPSGRPIFDVQGRPVSTATFVPIGNGIADWTGGLNNSVTYKGINLSFLIDFKIGGDIVSGTNMRLTSWGLHQQSLIGREGEAPLRITGVVNTGTEASPVFTPVDRDLTPNEARNYWGSVQGETNPVTTMFMYDASFAKLRQVTLGYSLPKVWLTKTPFKNVTVSAVGRNLALLFSNIENVDPESAYSTSAGAQGLEYFAMPTTRSFGFNVNLGF